MSSKQLAIVLLCVVLAALFMIPTNILAIEMKSNSFASPIVAKKEISKEKVSSSSLESSMATMPMTRQSIGRDAIEIFDSAGWTKTIAGRFSDGDTVVGRYSVGLTSITSTILQGINSTGAHVVAINRLANFATITIYSNDENSIATSIRNLPFVRYVEREIVGSVTTARTIESVTMTPKSVMMTPNDPRYSSQWGPSDIKLPGAWDLTTGSASVVVAVVDTGVDYGHEDLSANIWTDSNGYHGYDFVSNDQDPSPDSTGSYLSHGTHVAGIIGGVMNNGIGIAGTAQIKIMAVKACSGDGSCTPSAVANGISWAVANGADIISMSLRWTTPVSDIESAVNDAWSQGKIVVAASGNDNGPVGYPAKYTNVIAVGAIDSSNNRASFSNYGPELDLVAPGVSIESTIVGGYASWDGTSMATPFVSGVAALVLSKNPSLTNAEVVSILENSADDLGSAGKDDQYGYGRVDAQEAVVMAGIPTGAATISVTVRRIVQIDEVDPLSSADWYYHIGSFLYYSCTGNGIGWAGSAEPIATDVDNLLVNQGWTITVPPGTNNYLVGITMYVVDDDNSILDGWSDDFTDISSKPGDGVDDVGSTLNPPTPPPDCPVWTGSYVGYWDITTHSFAGGSDTTDTCPSDTSYLRTSGRFDGSSGDVNDAYLCFSISDNYVLPTANAGSDKQGYVGDSIAFNGGGTGSILSYAWTFGDGGTGTGPTPSHVYTSQGSYTATLTVTDDFGQTATDTAQVTIYALPQVTSVTANPTPGYIGDTISFSCTASGGKGSLTYAWTFGDGGTGSGQSTTHAYSSANTFTITCTVTDAGGKTANKQTQVTIYSVPIVTTVTATPTEGYVGDTISFSCTASGGKGSLTYAWTFGDGGTGSGQSTTHVYNSASIFTVRCTVTDGTKTAYKEIQITIYALPQVISVTATPTEGYVGDTISFSCTASGGKGSLTYTWTFGDGQTGSGQSTTHVYNSAGTYTVRCTVTDGTKTAYKEIQIAIYSLPIVNTVTATPPEGYVGDTISFSYTASGGKGSLTHVYDYGDGQTGQGSHIYNSAGTYTVRCTVTDQGGKTAYKEIQITIYAIPTVDAGPDKTGKTNNPISFDCTATGGKPTFSYLWDFGDGQNSGILTVCSTNHVYTSKGTYTAIVTATDGGGKSATDSVIVTISDVLPPPQVSATDPTNGATNVPITTNIMITFDQAMDHASTDGAISANPAITGTFSWDGTDTVVTWKSTAGLTASTKYTVTISTAATSKAGLNMANPYPFTFTTGTGSVPTPPTVLSTSPTNGAINIPLNTKISITFDKAMDKTPTEGAISASPSVTWTAAWSSGDTVITLTPSANLQISTQYTLMITTAAKSSDGKNMASQFQFSFTTGQSQDTTPPTVMFTTPIKDAIDVDTSTKIIIGFSEPMDKSATVGAISISPGSISSPAWSNGDATVMFTPSLSGGTKYTVTVSTTGAKDIAGNAIASPYTFSFTTKNVSGSTPPTILSTNPNNNAVNVVRDTIIIITFDKAMDKTATEGAISASPSISGTFSWDITGKVMTWDPSTELQASTKYTITILTAAKSSDGANLESEYKFSFTTGTSSNTTPPTVGGSDNIMFFILSLMIIIIALLIVVIIMRKKKKQDPPPKSESEEKTTKQPPDQ